MGAGERCNMHAPARAALFHEADLGRGMLHDDFRLPLECVRCGAEADRTLGSLKANTGWRCDSCETQIVYTPDRLDKGIRQAEEGVKRGRRRPARAGAAGAPPR